MQKDHLFLLDENVDIALKIFLEQKKYNCNRIRSGSSDKDVYAKLLSSSALFITHDKDFADINFYIPKTSSGIIIMRIHPPTFEHTSRALDHLLSSLDITNIYGKVIQVFPKGLEIVYDVNQF